MCRAGDADAGDPGDAGHPCRNMGDVCVACLAMDALRAVFRDAGLLLPTDIADKSGIMSDEPGQTDARHALVVMRLGLRSLWGRLHLALAVSLLPIGSGGEADRPLPFRNSAAALSSKHGIRPWCADTHGTNRYGRRSCTTPRRASSSWDDLDCQVRQFV